MTPELIEISGLLAKLSAGEMSEDEKFRLEEWRGRSEYNKSLYEKFLSREFLADKKGRYESVDTDSGWRGVRRKLRKKQGSRLSRNYVKYAAVLLLGLGLSAQLYNMIERNGGRRDAATDLVQVDEVVVTLADGRMVSLDSDNPKEISQGGTGLLLDYANDMLSYVIEGEAAGEELIHNQIYVPKGRTYAVMLSDGTIVVLNAMTTLKFPVNFTGDLREVELSGEAYFDVASDAVKPFTVHTPSDKITVLGTRFNVSSYDGDRCMRATLQEGSIKVTSVGSGKEFMISPNHQYTHDLVTGEQSVSAADVSYAVAWMDGYFRFRDMRFEDIMVSLGRWYDVELTYEDEEVKDIVMGLNVPKYNTIEPLLRIFEQNGSVRIIQEGRKLTVQSGI